MASILSRLFAVQPNIVEPNIEPAKAASGPWVAWASAYAPLASLSRNANRLMAEAEALFHSAPWVAEAERIISGRMGRVPYHLEDEDGETLTRKTSTLAASLLDALDKPSPGKTRRQLWSLTGRHMGLAGNGFWYLDQRDLLGGTPLQTLYINPARMTPQEDEAGNLFGWVMDSPNNPLTPRGIEPTPFEKVEIVHFALDEPDAGHWGIGIPESAQVKIELSRLADRHTGQVLASGGRLPGIVAPKPGETIAEDAWLAFVRDYRNITGDNESAKRMQIVRGPIDFTRTAATPTELQLTDIVTKGRDDTFALWGIPLSQAGIVSSRGLNSSDIPQFEEAALWQGPIEERLAVLREKVQHEFIDRWQALGLTATLVIETPKFDDLAPLFVNAEKAKALPLTNDERRDLIGLDPLEDEELGGAVYIDSSMVAIDAAAESNVEPVALLAPSAMQGTPDDMMVKASPLETLRSRIEATWVPRIERAVAKVLAAQRADIASRVEQHAEHLSRKPTDAALWWHPHREEKRWRDALDPLVADLSHEVASRIGKQLEMQPAKATLAFLGIAEFITRRTAERIIGINETTQTAVQAAITTGVEAGLSPVEVSKLILASTTFNEARAEMVARTETMFAYNDSALKSYETYGVEYVEALDGDKDEECASRNGREFPVSEAYAIADHPNGTLDWVPVVVPAKAEPVALVESNTLMAALKAAIEYGERPAPVIPAPIVNIEAAEAPVVNVDTSEFASALREIHAVLNKPKPKPMLERDADGRLIGIRYEDVT